MTFDWKHVVLIILLGFLAGWFFFSNRSHVKVERVLEDSASNNYNLYLAYKSSFDHAVLIHSVDSSLYDSVVKHQPKPVWYVKHDTAYLPDTTKPKLCESRYIDSLKIGKFRTTIELYIADCYVKDISYKNTVYPYDTLRLPPVVLPPVQVLVDMKLDRWGVWGGLGIFNTNSFPALQAGGFYFYKDVGFIQPGIGLDFSKKQPFFGVINAGVNLRNKK